MKRWWPKDSALLLHRVWIVYASSNQFGCEKNNLFTEGERMAEAVPICEGTGKNINRYPPIFTYTVTTLIDLAK
jgi:hypothetical protein